MKVPKTALLAGVLPLLLGACQKKTESAAPPPKDIGAQAADVVSDTDALREANAAANPVVRAAGDCDGVKAALPEANRRLDAVAGSVRTATGRTSLEVIRKRVNTIAETCP
jgi:hypothetical protein